MKHDFEERKERRASRYAELAQKAKRESEQRLQNANQLANIMNGQPILVGHHSEKRHRRDIERMHNNMGKSVEADRKAKYYTDRAAAIEESTAISGDDPNAIDKLKEKLASLQELQQLMIETNKVIRKLGGDKYEVADALREMGFTPKRIADLIMPNFSGAMGFEHWRLTNNNANIRRIKQRIEQLEKIESMETETTELAGDIKIILNVEANRFQVIFPGKPSEEIRTAMKKRFGLIWCPSENAWQRKLNGRMEYLKQEITKFLNPEPCQ